MVIEQSKYRLYSRWPKSSESASSECPFWRLIHNYGVQAADGFPLAHGHGAIATPARHDVTEKYEIRKCFSKREVAEDEENSILRTEARR